MSESNIAENSPEEPLDENDEARPVEEHVFDEIDPLPDQLRQAEERALRAQAELENFRKRARRELEDEQRYAQLPLVAALLPVVDNLDRALGAAQQSEGSAGLVEGVKMVADQLAMVLEQHDCKRIEDLGARFDPNLHEAIGQEPSEEHEAGVISRVTRSGYKLHERVVRPSQVMISTGPHDTQDAPPTPSD